MNHNEKKRRIDQKSGEHGDNVRLLARGKQNEYDESRIMFTDYFLPFNLYCFATVLHSVENNLNYSTPLMY